MKNRILAFVITANLMTLCLFSQESSVGLLKETLEAVALAKGAKGKIDRDKAFDILNKNSNAGIPEAMNALGLMYLNGYGCTVDTLKAIECLERAASMGSDKSMHNMAMLYKYGIGVRKDFKKSFRYMEQAALNRSFVGQYDAGYMLYKGLGCKQDYEKAVVYFQKSAELEYSPAMYMLGLCYRNGYGVNKDVGQANYWLRKSAKNVFRFAIDELATEEPENPTTRVSLKSASIDAVPDSFPKIQQVKKVVDATGTYDGTLVTYDWSGKHILKETPLTLVLTQTGDCVQGVWAEQGTDTVGIRGVWRDSVLVFDKSFHKRRDHYSPELPVKWQFSEASINLSSDGNGIFMAGNIQMESIETLEPQKPMYIQLRNSGSIALSNPEINQGAQKLNFKAYPNPFSSELNISFNLELQEDVSMAIYDSHGRCVVLKKLGIQSVGSHYYALSPQLSAGVYVLKLSLANKEYQTVIIQK